MDVYLSTHTIAARLGVHEETVRRWLRAGELQGVPLGRAGYRVSEAELQRFLAGRQHAVASPSAQPSEAAAQERAHLHAALAREQAARAAAEAATRRTEATFEAITDGIFIVDTQSRIPLINRAARAMLCVPDDAPAQYPTIPPFELLHADGTVIPREGWPQVRLFAGEVMHPQNAMDMLLRTVDGRVRQINITGAPLRDAQGDITGVVVVCRDVTERRQLEQRTVTSLAALLTMAEQMTLLPSAATAPERNEDALAQRLVELLRQVLGCQRASLTVMHPMTGAFRSAAVAGITAAEERAWRDRRPGAVLRDYLADPDLDARLRAEGAAILDLTQPPWNAKPAPYGIQTLLLVVLGVEGRTVGILALDHDGTAHQFTPDEVTLAKAVGKLAALVLERERLLHERAAALTGEAAMRAANQRMDDFLSIASHELRTPMTTIKMSLQLLSRRVARLAPVLASAAPEHATGISEMAHLLERAEGQADRQTRLLGDLLDATRIQSGKMTYRFDACDLAALLRDGVAEAANLDPRRRITLMGDADPCMVEADADRIRQVIMNYLTNALKYSATDAPVAVCLERVGSLARVSVRDHGRGLSPEAQAHIWERFYRAPDGRGEDTAVEGLGLGLFICRTIVAAHHGEVGVQSAEGVGSTFWFTLPLAVTA